MILASMMILGFSSTMALAANADDMAYNFDTCVHSDSSWFNRWGAYVVSFHVNEARQICRAEEGFGSDARLTGCRVSGQWLPAGYYCTTPPDGGN